jgi:predicted TIM-barrel fold metal-dependent hydrolase
VPTGDAAGGPFDPGFPCIDVHVHMHPARLARAIERHFAGHGWIAGHSFDPDAVAAALRARGIERYCFFTYAHKPGIARSLNHWVAETAARLPEAVPLGTLHPDDPDLLDVAAEATDTLGLRGFKFHHSVQRFHVDDPRLAPVYARAEAAGHLLMLHVGTMPYRDPFTGIAGLLRVLARHPRLRVCVAHMGEFERPALLPVLARYEHLYVDTTMALAPAAAAYVGAVPTAITDADLVAHQDRILFGSDFPVIPYDYDEERRWAWDRSLPDTVRRKIFRENAKKFLGLH